MQNLDLHYILDRSGSMFNKISDILGGVNNSFAKQKGTKSRISLYLFDDYLDTIYQNKEIDTVPELDETVYFTRGSTALLDAIGKVIKSIKKGEDPIYVFIYTDGEENSSITYTPEHIKDLIEQKEKDGWNFVFMAANQDAVLTAQKLGIPGRAAISTNEKKYFRSI